MMKARVFVVEVTKNELVLKFKAPFGKARLNTYFRIEGEEVERVRDSFIEYRSERERHLSKSANDPNEREK